MTTPTALLAALLTSTVLNKPGPYPGADGILEIGTGSISISGTSTTGTVSISLDGRYEASSDMRIALSKQVSLSAAASDPGQVTLEVTSKGTGSITVEATLATAPGTGETTTVDVDAIVAGLPSN